MNVKNKKEWLKSYLGSMQVYKALLEERGRWLDAATHITPVYSDTPEGRGKYDLQRSVDKLADIDARILGQLEAIERQRAEIISAIDRLKDGRYRAVLRYRYLNGCSFELIAAKMHYNCRWVKELHRQAIEKIEVK